MRRMTALRCAYGWKSRNSRSSFRTDPIGKNPLRSMLLPTNGATSLSGLFVVSKTSAASQLAMTGGSKPLWPRPASPPSLPSGLSNQLSPDPSAAAISSWLNPRRVLISRITAEKADVLLMAVFSAVIRALPRAKRRITLYSKYYDTCGGGVTMFKNVRVMFMDYTELFQLRMVHNSLFKFGSLTFLLLVTLSACGSTVQSIAQDCRIKHSSFSDYNNCTQTNFLKDPSGTTPSYYNPFLEGLNAIDAEVKSGKLTDQEAFSKAAEFRMALDERWQNIYAKPTNPSATTNLLGTALLLQSMQPRVTPPPTTINCHTMGAWTRCN